MPFGLGDVQWFFGDVVESLNAFLKDIFLTAASRGVGKGTLEEQLIELLFQAMSGGSLYKKMPRWREVEGLGALQIQHCADIAREYLGEMLESRCCIPMGPPGGKWFVTAQTILVGLNPFESIRGLQVGHLNHVGLFKCHSNVVYFTCFDLSAASWCSRWAFSVIIPVLIKGPVVMAGLDQALSGLALGQLHAIVASPPQLQAANSNHRWLTNPACGSRQVATG